MGRTLMVAGVALAFFIVPAISHAANLNSLTEVVNAGLYLHEGDTVYRGDFAGQDSYWRFRFTFPYGVGNPQALLAVARGTFGNLAGGAPAAGVNYVVNYQTWNAGASDIVKSMGFPMGGAMPSGTYTAIVANEGGSFATAGFMNWFASGGTAGVEPSDYSFLTFNYIAGYRTDEIPGALTQVQYADRVMHEGEEVFKSEVAPSVDNPSEFWRFAFDWPNAVDNAHAAFMVFRGMYGALDGGTAVSGVNYGANLQSFPSGHNTVGKFISQTLESATDSTYTVMVAELNSAGSISEAANWFATGGAAGIGPRRYSTIMFDFKKYHECCSSVVFLPGFKGSILKTGSDTLWPSDAFGADIPQLTLTEAGESVNPVVVGGILPRYTIHIPLLGDVGPEIYSGFSSFMDGLVSAHTIKDWEPLPYDWRFSPDKILEDGSIVSKVEQLAAESDTGQVAIVAHSMGGLVGKALIKKLEEKGEAGLIDSFVMIATPQLGTPQAAAALLHGDHEGIPGKTLIPNFVATRSIVRASARDFPSAYDLLPSARYFDEVTDPVLAFDEASFTEAWRNYWGEAITAYTPFVEFLTGTGVGRVRPTPSLVHIPEVLRADLVASSSNLHVALDTYPLPPHIRVVQVAGWGEETTKGIEYKNQHFVQGYDTIPTVEGDGIVVYPSAVASVGESYYLNLSLLNKNESSDVEHSTLFSSAPIQSVLQSIVSEEVLQNIDYLSSTKPPLTEVVTQLIVSTHSPVILGATDGAGNFTGIYPNQDLSADLLYVQEGIPGSTFLATGESQHLFLPKGGIYTVTYQGTGTGPTTVEIAEFSNDMITPIVAYTDIPTAPETSAIFTVDSASPQDTDIEVDTDGDEIFELIVSPDSDDLTLGELLAALKTKIQGLDIKEKANKNLLKKVEKLEKKIAKQKFEKASKIVMNLGKKILKKGEHGKITDTDVQELLDLLGQIENAI